MSRSFWVWTAILAVAACVRLATLDAYPLADTTEARYGEIARLMLDSGDWITPQIDTGVPFWGKPPLSFWLTAASFKAFGISEFAARLPSFLMLLASAALIIRFGFVSSGRVSGLAAGAILMTSALGFISAGAVMTDPSLLLSTTLVMVGFWRGVIGRQRRWAVMMFAGLGIGLLAKGPIAWVLGLTPVFVWLAWRGDPRQTLRELPWRSGLAVLAALAVPWYVAAEIRTPGFLEYFLVGEHWMRFVDSGWQGDLYGTAHTEPRGTIWLYWLAASFPWCLIALALLVRNWRRYASVRRIDDRRLYLLLCAATPMVFFTFSGNILATYVLPGLPALALLLSDGLDRDRGKLMHAGWAIPAVFAILGPLILFDRVAENSQQELIALAQANPACSNIVYFPKRPYSAEFYSGGKALLATDETELRRVLSAAGTSCLAVRHRALPDLSARITKQLLQVRIFKKHVLFVERQPPATLTDARPPFRVQSSNRASSELGEEAH